MLYNESPVLQDEVEEKKNAAFKSQTEQEEGKNHVL